MTTRAFRSVWPSHLHDDPFGSEIVALLGVVLGAVIAGSIGILQAGLARRHDAQRRWQERKLAAYLDYARAVKNMVQALRELAVSKGFAYGAATTEAAARQHLHEANLVRASAWEPVLLLADAHVVQVARAWHARVWDMEHQLADPNITQGEWECGYGQLAKAREAYYAGVRLDLGVQPTALD